jgi:hypothetical protein
MIHIFWIIENIIEIEELPLHKLKLNALNNLLKTQKKVQYFH